MITNKQVGGFMELFEVMVGKFEDGEDFGVRSHLYIDEKSVFDILAVKDEERKCAINIETLEEYRYFDRDDKNRIMPYEGDTIKPNVFYALRFEKADLSKKRTLEKLSIALKARTVTKKIEKQKQIKR